MGCPWSSRLPAGSFPTWSRCGASSRGARWGLCFLSTWWRALEDLCCHISRLQWIAHHGTPPLGLPDVQNNAHNSNDKKEIHGIIYLYFTLYSESTYCPRDKWKLFHNCLFYTILHIDILSTSWQTGLPWVPQRCIDDKSTLVQVMTWCHRATTHYLSLCWPRSMVSLGNYESMSIWHIGNTIIVFTY